VQQLRVLGEVVEMLVDPVLEHVEDAELDGLAVLLPEPLQVLGVSHLAGLVG